MQPDCSPSVSVIPILTAKNQISNVIIETCICIKKRSVPVNDGMQESEVFFHHRNKKYAGTIVHLWTFWMFKSHSLGKHCGRRVTMRVTEHSQWMLTQCSEAALQSAPKGPTYFLPSSKPSPFCPAFLLVTLCEDVEMHHLPQIF